MGYTHYWNPNRKFTDAEWSELTAAAGKVVDHLNKDEKVLAFDSDGRDALMPPTITDYMVRFNGIEGDGHETFVLEKNGNREFCKTAEKPYDLAVCAVLMLAHDVAPGALDIASDGKPEDWQPAADLLKQLFGKEFAAPFAGQPT